MIWRVIGPVALVGLLGAAAVAGVQTHRVSNLTADLAISEARAQALGARIDLIREKLEDDRVVDDTSADDLRDLIRDEWLRGAPTGR